MVRLVLGMVLLSAAGGLYAQPQTADSSAENAGPVLFGDGAGRIWKWQAGTKVYLTPAGSHYVLGGIEDEGVWGWVVEQNRARFFTLAGAAKKPDSTKKPSLSPVPPMAKPRFETQAMPIPDQVVRRGARMLLVYGAQSAHPRWELWQAGVMAAARAYDDGRVVYTAALGPEEGSLVAGRTADGRPWLEVSGTEIEAPTGWRGRISVAVWVSEAEGMPARPQAAGWGAPGGEPPRALFWGPTGWSQPEAASGSVFPLLGMAGGDGVFWLGGWQADEGTGVLRPWFWTGTEAIVPGGAADGQPQAFSPEGETGPFMVVRHQTPPWFTFEDGTQSQALEGFGPDDRVVVIQRDELPKPGP